MKKKILFVLTVNPYDEKKYFFPPLGLGYLISSLKRHFGKNYFEFKVVTKNLYREVNTFKPDIVCISSATQNYNIAKNYAKYSKRNGALVIVGGIHISTLPFSLSEDMDIGVIGEGEETLVDLLQIADYKYKLRIGNVNSNFQSSVFNLQSIKGIVYCENGKLIQTEKRQFLDVNEILHPDREFIDDRKNCLIFSSRGCPYNCPFCSYPGAFGKERIFPANYIVEEIKEIFSRKINFITFADYLLALDKKRLREIVDLLKEEKIINKIHFSSSTYSNLIDDEVCELFKEMGVASVSMSLISGANKTLKTIGSPHSLSQAQKAIFLLNKNNISCYGSFVIGLPDERKEDIKETFNFIKSSNLNSFDVYLPVPYPATQLWEWAEEKKLVSKDMDWDKLNTDFYHYHKKAVIISFHLTRNDLYKEFRKFARLKFILKIKDTTFYFLNIFFKKFFNLYFRL